MDNHFQKMKKDLLSAGKLSPNLIFPLKCIPSCKHLLSWRLVQSTAALETEQ